MVELTKIASETARVIEAYTDNRAPCGYPAPNAFETLVLKKQQPKEKPIRKIETNSITFIVQMNE